MLSLHTNSAALSTQNALGNTQKALNTALTRLGTGYKVNSAMDDAAGLQIATRLDAQTRGMTVAQNNTQNGVSMMQTAEGAFNELTNVLQRMKDLSTQAADASTSSQDKVALQQEYNALGQELGNIMTNTSFGGQQLFTTGTAAATVPGSGGLLGASLTFQIGASSAETMTVDTSSSLSSLKTALVAVSNNYVTPADAATVAVTNPSGVNAAGTFVEADGVTVATTGIELATGTSANGEIDKLNTALNAVGSIRAQLGAASNRLDHVNNNLGNMITNASASRGRIMDVDYASETSTSASQQLLLQAGTAALKQSNSLSQLVISLMQ
jgi:flagellin